MTSNAFDGELILGDDPRFEDSRVDRVFNRRLPARRPAAVLKAASERDVVAGVRLARERGWQVAVRSGGHSWAHWSIRDDALVIDLGGLQEIGYTEASGVVTVSPAVQGGSMLSPFLEQRGRFFPGGHCPTVGVGGFLLQGGQGWNARGWGWAAEYVAGVDVVTAAGELLHANEHENTDLYWAARGAGPGFFGVVTRFHLRTRPMFGHCAHTVQIYSLAEYDEVMAWLHGMHHTLADTVELVALTRTVPEVSERPVLVVVGLALVEDQAEAERALAPFRSCPALPRALVSVDTEKTTLAEQQARQLRENPEGLRWAVDNAWLCGSPAEVIAAARRAYTDLPNDRAFTIWFSMAPLRELPDMAFSLQSEVYLASYVAWDDPADDERCLAWLAAAMTDVEPVTVGQYLGDSDLSRRQLQFMSDENWARLQSLRARHDPDRLFVGYLAGEGPTNRNHWEPPGDASAHPEPKP